MVADEVSAQAEILFEDAVNLISDQVYSPIAKVIAYKQVIDSIVPDFDSNEADENQRLISSIILNLKMRHSIENLFIDIKFCEDFIPPNQWVLQHFQVVSHIIGCLKLIILGSADVDKSMFGSLL